MQYEQVQDTTQADEQRATSAKADLARALFDERKGTLNRCITVTAVESFRII